ncbi:MAG: BlaI/MecI/CopY family transcriptional regulator [Thermoguttaceae bacterium]
MPPKDPLFDLGKRERQIVEAVFRLGEASVSDVLAAIADPPSYSSVRAMLGTLVQKDVLAYRHEGKRYLYRPVASKGKTQKSAVRRLVAGLFGGRASDVMAALLDVAGGTLTDEELDRIRQLIDQTRKENR